MTKEIIIAILGLIGSGGIAAILSLFINKRKTTAEAKQIETSSDITVLNAQNDLLEKLLERSQKLVEDNEKLQKGYGEMLVENARLRSDIVQHLGTISMLQKDTKAMRIEVQAIMARVKEIDDYLLKMSENGSNSNPFPEKTKSF